MGFHLGQDSEQGISELNLIPLIDIMLVLMVIFLVTASVATPVVDLQLPQTHAQPQPAPPQARTISIDAQGQVYWQDQPRTLATLAQDLQAVAAQDRQTPIHVRVDRQARYDTLAQVMAAVSGAGLSQLGFVSDTPVGTTAKQ